MSRSGSYLLMNEDGQHDGYQPSPSTMQSPPPAPVTMSQSNNTNVVELQPMSGQQPVIQVVPKPQANDHLYLTVALIFLCLLLNCNTLGALCLIPGLICAAVGADYNKAGDTEKARSCGSMAFVYDMVILILHAVGYTLGVIITVIVVAVVFSKANDAVSTISEINNGFDDYGQ